MTYSFIVICGLDFLHGLYGNIYYYIHKISPHQQLVIISHFIKLSLSIALIVMNYKSVTTEMKVWILILLVGVIFFGLMTWIYCSENESHPLSTYKRAFFHVKCIIVFIIIIIFFSMGLLYFMITIFFKLDDYLTKILWNLLALRYTILFIKYINQVKGTREVGIFPDYITGRSLEKQSDQLETVINQVKETREVGIFPVHMVGRSLEVEEKSDQLETVISD